MHNRLNSVNDLGTAAGMPTGTSAYTYDRDGRLARDVRENLGLRWTVDNKISQVLKNGSVFVYYLYDAAGNRVMKRLPNDTLEILVRDGNGIELERITRRSNTNLRIEGMVLGSEHMGTQQLPLATTPDTVEARIANSAAYELSDHLGNVRVTVSDLKTFTALSASSYSLTARATSATDYYPFGLPSRSFQPGYKWGFNGKENDRELLTGGRMQDYGFRAYRPDLGRFFAVDPLAREYPYYTPYQFAGNDVIRFIDLDGLEPSALKVLYDEMAKIKKVTDKIESWFKPKSSSSGNYEGNGGTQNAGANEVSNGGKGASETKQKATESTEEDFNVTELLEVIAGIFPFGKKDLTPTPSPLMPPVGTGETVEKGSKTVQKADEVIKKYFPTKEKEDKWQRTNNSHETYDKDGKYVGDSVVYQNPSKPGKEKIVFEPKEKNKKNEKK